MGNTCKLTDLWHTFLLSNGLWLFSRIVITFIFWMTAINWIIDFNEATSAANLVSLSPPSFWGCVLIAFYLLGSIFIIIDKMTWLGAGAFIVFLILTIIMVHHFWTMPPKEEASAWNEVKEHISLMGGLFIVSIASEYRHKLKRNNLLK